MPNPFLISILTLITILATTPTIANTNQNEIQKEIILYFRLIGRTGMENDTTMKFMDIILKLTTVSKYERLKK
jgi:hypothetical protein